VLDVDLSWWMPIYRRIAETLGLSEEEDRRAAGLMADLASGKSVEPYQLEELLAGRPVLVAWNGPNLERDLATIVGSVGRADFAVLAADGAAMTTYSLLGRVPDAIVSDLDGRNAVTLRLAEMGALPVVHAHGDNVPALQRWVPRLPRLLPTTQVEPVGPVRNFGGFTDGDRAAFLALAAGADGILLAGVDLTSSSPLDILRGKDLGFKRAKLGVAAWMVELLARDLGARVYVLPTARGLEGSGVKAVGDPSEVLLR